MTINEMATCRDNSKGPNPQHRTRILKRKTSRNRHEPSYFFFIRTFASFRSFVKDKGIRKIIDREAKVSFNESNFSFKLIFFSQGEDIRFIPLTVCRKTPRKR
jgi:hypothetical protein